MQTRKKPITISGITNLPASAKNMRIGLFGGSFNPPHPGHQLVSRQALKRLNLDNVWWLVTPGNPLKDHSELNPLENRVNATRTLITHPRIKATGFEAKHGFTHTYETIKFLKTSLPDRKFVWIMGADSFENFHLWDRWRDIVALVPLAIYVRPGSALTALSSRAAHTLMAHRLDEHDAKILAGHATPSWVYLSGRMSALSSTALRER